MVPTIFPDQQLWWKWRIRSEKTPIQYQTFKQKRKSNPKIGSQPQVRGAKAAAVRHREAGREAHSGRCRAIEVIRSANASEPHGKNRFLEFPGKLGNPFQLELLPSRSGRFQIAESPLHPPQAH